MTSHGKLSYQRDSWATLVFGSEFRSTPDDFNAKEFGLDDLMRALRSSEARVRMKALVTLALRKDVPAKTLLSVGILVVDEDT